MTDNDAQMPDELYATTGIFKDVPEGLLANRKPIWPERISSRYIRADLATPPQPSPDALDRSELEIVRNKISDIESRLGGFCAGSWEQNVQDMATDSIAILDKLLKRAE